MTAVVLSIPLTPMPKQRPRFGQGRAYMADSYTDWKRRFTWLARSQWKQPMLTGAVGITATFQTPTGRMRPDADNCFGAVLDALESIVYANDRCVVRGAYAIARGAEYRITVEVEALAEVVP